MADIFLRSSDGSDGNAGTDKSAPKATLSAAVTAAGNAGRVFVSDLHAETQASAMTITPPTSLANLVRIVCVPDWGAASGTTAPTSRSTGATVSTTGANNISFVSGFLYSYGVDYQAGNSNNAADINIGTSSNLMLHMFVKTTFKLLGNNAGSDFILGNGISTPVQSVIFRDVIFHHANVGNRTLVRVGLLWRNSGVGSAVAATVPTTFLSTTGGSQGPCRVEAVDLSALGSGKNIVDVSTPPIKWHFSDCKLNASVTRVTGTQQPYGTDVTMVNCNAGDVNYDYYRNVLFGTETHEATIVRTGGASDGTTPIARKIVTSSSAGILTPYESLPIELWNETIGSAITITIPVVTDGVTLTDAEAWIEVEYLGTSGFPLGLFANDRVSDPIFGSAANQASDAVSSWTTTGLSSPVKQTLDVTITPQEKGIIRVRVCVAKASATMYYDPLAQVA